MPVFSYGTMRRLLRSVIRLDGAAGLKDRIALVIMLVHGSEW